MVVMTMVQVDDMKKVGAGIRRWMGAPPKETKWTGPPGIVLFGAWLNHLRWSPSLTNLLLYRHGACWHALRIEHHALVFWNQCRVTLSSIEVVRRTIHILRQFDKFELIFNKTQVMIWYKSSSRWDMFIPIVTITYCNTNGAEANNVYYHKITIASKIWIW